MAIFAKIIVIFFVSNAFAANILNPDPLANDGTQRIQLFDVIRREFLDDLPESIDEKELDFIVLPSGRFNKLATDDSHLQDLNFLLGDSSTTDDNNVKNSRVFLIYVFNMGSKKANGMINRKIDERLGKMQTKPVVRFIGAERFCSWYIDSNEQSYDFVNNALIVSQLLIKIENDYASGINTASRSETNNAVTVSNAIDSSVLTDNGNKRIVLFDVLRREFIEALPETINEKEIAFVVLPSGQFDKLVGNDAHLQDVTLLLSSADSTADKRMTNVRIFLAYEFNMSINEVNDMINKKITERFANSQTKPSIRFIGADSLCVWYNDTTKRPYEFVESALTVAQLLIKIKNEYASPADAADANN